MARIMMQAFAQLRDGIFAKVALSRHARGGVSTFAHVHTLSLRFHLERKTGGLSRVIERGIKGIDTLLSFALFSIFPTILWNWPSSRAILLVDSNIWVASDHGGHGGRLYLVHLRHHPLAHPVPPRDEPSDTDANTKAVDSLLNFETVKYFNNEAHETAASTSRWRNIPTPRSSRRFRCPSSTPARRDHGARAWGW